MVDLWCSLSTCLVAYMSIVSELSLDVHGMKTPPYIYIVAKYLNIL